jgi:hypothetical protein
MTDIKAGDKDLWPDGATYGEMYDPAMEVQTEQEAAAYLDRLIRYQVAHGVHPDIATKIIKVNLAYWAAYGSHERRERIERLYGCEHPVFGSIKENGPPTTNEAFQLGLNRSRGEFEQTLAELRKSRQEP